MDSAVGPAAHLQGRAGLLPVHPVRAEEREPAQEGLREADGGAEDEQWTVAGGHKAHGCHVVRGDGGDGALPRRAGHAFEGDAEGVYIEPDHVLPKYHLATAGGSTLFRLVVKEGFGKTTVISSIDGKKTGI